MGFMNKRLDSFEKYLVRKLNFYNSAINLTEHSGGGAELDAHDYRLLREELVDIIQHFEKLVKNEKERKANDRETESNV